MSFSMRMLLVVLISLGLPLATAQAGTQKFEIQGFRSAHFGMDQAETLQAISTDFGVPPSKVQHESNPVQYTQALSITVQNLLPQSGPAVVDYVFGYKSHILSEINVTWQVGPGGAAALVHTGVALQNYFKTEPFPPGDIMGDKLLPTGTLLLFRGTDAAGHAVILVLDGKAQHDDKTNKTNLTPTFLTLIYAQDPSHPDVFKIGPGAF